MNCGIPVEEAYGYRVRKPQSEAGRLPQGGVILIWVGFFSLDPLKGPVWNVL